MIRLTREVRFSIVDSSGTAEQPDESAVTNSWGGWPSVTSIAPWLVFKCTLKGEIDPASGYLCNIKRIDDALRDKVISRVSRYRNESFESLLRFAYQEISDSFPDNCQLESLRLLASPTLDYSISHSDVDMIELTQQFEFSASHRLHNPKLTDDQNRELYGKCNNPHGHGHNYVLNVTVTGNPGEKGTVVPLHDLETLVKKTVIDRMDHRYLNLEVEEFQETNPSVENIAVVIWDLLESEIDSFPGNESRLSRVQVYETPKTWAEYRGATER